ncbi:flagellar hook-length control protein FliK [Paracoccus hibiscisoli]|uniref:Flagellar hook-length control protein-like C-terminal domain-containing protein n=1 Tax=Paracoccus hibiscisoli TaxID=2023261 RepID=A0A4U0QYA9_9RHOB|nr:flagellar hook-length control protein FliK [Paracoccus hibiscisoli]TJZ87315.1 hypothetical protein FA740_01010 [Paracoccus hibiscisoli]
MVDIQIVPTPSPQPVPLAGSVPATGGGDSGFALWPGLGWPGTPWPVAASPVATPVAPPPADGAAVAPDPLSAWMEEQQGFSSQFAPAPSDPLIDLADPEQPPMIATLPPAASETPEPEPAQPGALPQHDAVLGDTPPEDSAPEGRPATPAPAAQPVPDAIATVVAAAPVAAVAAAPVLAAETPIRDRRPTVQSDAPRVTAPGPAPVAAAAPPIVPDLADDRVMPPSPKATEASQSTPTPGTATPDRVASTPPREMAAAPRPEAPAPTGLAAALAEFTPELPPGAEPLASRVTPTGAPVAGTAAWQAAAQDPRPVLQQVAEALVTTRGDRTEIALSPEELGRIRMVMSGPDRAHIVIWAERPETLDLVRRNADQLAQQLAEAGVNAGTMEFRRDDRPEWQGHRADASERDGDAVAPAAVAIRLSQTPLSDRRVDIRL